MQSNLISSVVVEKFIYLVVLLPVLIIFFNNLRFDIMT